MTILISKNKFISELLPYDAAKKTQGSLKASLREYQLLLTATSSAVMALQRGELEKFDAVVGENACQIRAVKIAMMFPEYLRSLQSIQERIEKATQKVGEISQSLNTFMKRGISLQMILQEVDVALTSDDFFIIQSFLLSKAKAVQTPSGFSFCRNEVAKPQALKEFGRDVSGQFTERLVRKTRQLLSAASVDFVREQAQFLNNAQLEEMCSANFTAEYNSWPCIPMFWTYKTLLLTTEKKGIPLIIHAKFLDRKEANTSPLYEEYIFFKSDGLDSFGSYEETFPYPEDLTKAAVVIQGIADPLLIKSVWKSTISTQMRDVILAGAADHRQYPDAHEDHRIKSLGDEEFEKYRTIAKRDGYALDNPRMFFMQHTYASVVGSFPVLSEKARSAERILLSLPEPSIGRWPERVITPILSYLED